MVFDSIRKGNTLLAKYQIRNFGQAPLKMEQVILNCDCTQQLTQNLTVQPGATEPLHFAIDTRGFNKGYNERAMPLLGNFRPFFKFLRVEVYVI